MYYFGYFRNNDTSKDSNGQLYKVVIITNFQNGEFTVGGELTLSDSPFTVEYKSEDNMLHKPYKCSMATVGLYQSDINYSFNSTRGNDVYVSLLKLKEGVKFKYGNESVTTDKTNYTVEWCGFATPNAYSQDYESDFDLYELECQDALSTLQYFNYKTVFENQKIVTFYDIIRNITAYLGTYTDIYITDGIKVPITDNGNITNYLCINERNFFDEDNKPEKMLDVLDNILQYLTLTVVPHGNKLYILNYDLIGNDYNFYHHITFNKSNNYNFITKENRIYTNWVTKGIVELKDEIEILPELFAESGTKFSLGETFNSVKVSDDFYFAEGFEILEDNVKFKLDKSTLKTYNITQVNDSGTGVNKYNITVNKSDETGTKITDGNSKVFFNKYYDFISTPDVEIKNYWWKDSFTIDEEVTSTDPNEGTETTEIISSWNSSVQVGAKPLNYDTINNYTGAIVVDEAVAEDNLSVPKYTRKIYLHNGLDVAKTGGFSHYQIKSFINNEFARKQKVLEITLKNQTVTKDDYIILNGTYDFYKIAVPLSDYKVGTDNSIRYNYVWAQLECDGKFWDGTQWLEKESTEKVFINGAGWILLGKLFKLELESSNCNHATIPKNVGYPQGLTVTGWGVKIPYDGDKLKPVDVKLTLFRTFGLSHYYETDLTVISDFDFNIYSPVRDIFNSDSNTELTNEIDSESIEEYQDVEFNITTYDGKDKDYSTVYYTENNTVTNVERLKTTHNLVTGELVSSEEHCISSICRQYNKPNTILTINLKGEYKPYTTLKYHFFNNKLFVIDSNVIDYINNSNTLTIVEKLIDKNTTVISKGNKKRQYQRNGEIIFNDSSIKKDDNVITHSYNETELPTYKLNENNGNLYITEYGDTTL